MTSNLTIGELVGFAIGTPEPGAINLKVLQALLRSIIKSLAIGDIQTEFDRKTIDDMQRRVIEPPIYTTLVAPLTFSKVESIEEDDGFVADRMPMPRRRSSLQPTGDDSFAMMNRNRRGSTGMIWADERARPVLLKKPLTPMLSLRELEMKVSRLEENWSKMNQLRLLKQQQSEVHDEDVDDAFRPPMTVYEMWQSVQFEKKLDANTEGVNRLMSLTQDIIRKLQKINEPETEQRNLTEKSHDKLRTTASNSNFDTIQAQLNHLSEMVQQLPSASILNSFITWAALESSLKGDDPLHVMFETEQAVNLDGRTIPHDQTKEKVLHEGTGHHPVTKGKKKPVESITSSDAETKKIKSLESRADPQRDQKEMKPDNRKAGTQPETKGKKSVESRSGPQPQNVQRGDVIKSPQQVITHPTTSSSGLMGAETNSVALTGSESLESSYGGSDVVRVDSMDHGQPLLEISPDFLNRLHALGKVNERFERLESKLGQLESLNKTRGKDVAPPSNVALNNITKQMEAVNKEIRNYKETQNELNAVQEQLSRSKMPSMAYSHSILAASRTSSLGTNDSATPEPLSAEGTDEGAQQVKRSRSVAFDSIEKSMKVIDSTLAVLQHSVKQLDDKLKKQLENVNRRLDTMRVDAMEGAATPNPDDDDDDEEVMESNSDNLGSRVSYLEKTMAEKQREMKKVQSQMTDLSADVSKQMEGMMNNFNQFVHNLEHEFGMKASAASAQDDTMNVMYGVQNTFSDMRSEVEKLKTFTIELYDSSKRQQNEIDTLHHYADDLKEKADETQREVHANRNALEQKVDSEKFDETCAELSKTISALWHRVGLLDSEWQTMVEKLSVDLKNYLPRDEFDSLSVNMIDDIRDLAKKLSRLQKQVDAVRFLGDDAAAVKRQLFSCLCCDRPVVMTTKSPRPSIPYREGLFSRRSTRPFTTYGLEKLRQNARGFVRPKNMSNYERALYERRLTRSSIRDLRSDCANYWRSSTHSNNFVGPCSTDRDHHQVTPTPSTTPSQRQNLITNDPTVQFQDPRNDQHSSATEGVASHPPVHTVSETSNQGSLPSGELVHPGSYIHPQVEEEEKPSVFSSKDTTSLPTESRSLQLSNDEATMRPDDTQQLQTNPSDGEDTSRRNSEPSTPPRNQILRRGTPANLGLGQFVKVKAGVRPNALTIAEEDGGSRRRSSGGDSTASDRSVRLSFQLHSSKRRQTPAVLNQGFSMKALNAAREAASAIAEEDDASRQRPAAASSGKEKSLLPSLPASLSSRRATPAIAKPIALSAKVRIAGQAAAFSIEEEEERSRRPSTETSGKEKSLHPSLPASLASRRATPALAKAIAIPAKVRVAGQAAAFSIEEEEEKSRRKSTETSVNEALQDKRSDANTPNSAHHPTNEEADVSTAAESRRDSDKTSDRKDGQEEDLSEKKQEGNSE